MRIKFSKTAPALLATLMIAVFSSYGYSAGKVSVKGSTTVLPITQKAIEAYAKIKKDVAISVDGSGSSNGIKALLDGNTDIAQSSRDMKEKEYTIAKNKGMAIQEIVVAYDMIVPVVHPSNPVANLTMDQLKDIYEGKITNWKEVGGPKMNIVVISRDTSSGTYELWHGKVLKKADVSKKALLQASNGAVVSAVANNKKAIGYIGFGYLNSSVKGLTVNDITPTLALGKSGKYPISRKLFMYVNKKNYSRDAQGFVKFILSDKGQELVKEAGYIPLK